MPQGMRQSPLLASHVEAQFSFQALGYMGQKMVPIWPGDGGGGCVQSHWVPKEDDWRVIEGIG